ncbi:MAG: NYN domain-containing protein, partial [Verrucomicrobiota bacterium]
DALDLCYTKAHVDTFVVVSGDSDFSPLVSKLRENNKVVIGVGVKHSTSDLLVANCDEFIFYDELVAKKKRPTRKATSKSASKKSAAAKSGKADKEIEFVVETIESLIEEIGDRSSLWGSRVKQVIKRQRPGFNEQSAGFKSFNALLEEARDRGLIVLRADEKSGGYVIESV